MQQIEGRVVLSPTDLTKHLACPHITTLDLQAVRDGAARGAQQPDDALQLVFRKGLEHEAAYLGRLRDRVGPIATIPTRFDGPGRQEAEALTLEAMRSGADVIYQATFYDGSWGGQADFLLRRERPSALGSWCYDIADTKLARRLKVPALLQMAAYAERLAELQGVPPETLTVVTGDGAERPWRLVDVASYARRVRRRLADFVHDPPPTAAVPVWHCSQCRWAERCQAQWQRADDLSLVAGMRRTQRQALLEHGIGSMSTLAAARPEDLADTGIGRATRERLTQQARLQVLERDTGRPAYELLSPVPGKGLLHLPPPSRGDVYLDFEGDPFADDGAGREYLAGLWDRAGHFTSRWAHSRDEERALTRDLVDDLVRRWRADPQLHVYHYAPYEQSALKRLTGRHGTREAELDQLLRAECFVDLYAVVRQGIRVSKPSYSIKALEAFYWDQSRQGGGGALADAMSSVVAYEQFLVEGDAAVLTGIESYNRDDVRSTHDLHSWLERRRAELEGVHGTLPRVAPGEDTRREDSAQAEVAEAALAGRLHMAGHPLLAALVGWHRREGRPGWWDFFRVEELDDDDLVEDSTTLGALSKPVHVRDVLRSKVFRYTFPPQDCRLSVGKDAMDVDTHDSVGSVVGLDPAGGWLEVRIGKARSPARPRGLGPPGPIDTRVLQRSIAHVAELVLAGEPALGGSLLARVGPADLAARPGEQPDDVVVRVGRSLHGEVLAVQGPPGSGKTTVGARLIQRLLRDGCRVGVTAQSHAVIGQLLKAVDRPGLQKCAPEDHCGSPQVQIAADNRGVLDALASGAAALVGGSAWLWAREDMRGAVDVLVIDEAGQFSLANAVAVSSAARSLVLLGDPQQLTSPTQAVHPDGGGVSALAHLMDGHDTIPSGAGIFLDTTWRMHPSIADFVSVTSYDGRLASGPGRERQYVQAPGRLLGSGLRFVPVDHTGNASASGREAEAVAALVSDLMRGSWTDYSGASAQLSESDVLVVAPYNRQVAMLRAVLPEAVAVGTVDKFQGRQAPVVIYSMASSSAADAPRGVEFLYDLHRLNVAVSRARALTVIVASPALLDADVHTPDQLRAVNALCHYAEMAEQVAWP